jgi:hypothetical protein
MDTYGRVFDSAVGPVPAGTSTINPKSCSGWSALPTVGGFGHSCAATTDNAVSCWGANYGDQVSDAPKTLISVAGGRYIYPTQLSTTGLYT